MKLELDPSVQSKLEEIAGGSNLSIEQACQLILRQFTRVYGGRIYVGAQKGGGLMYVVQWPFLTGFEKKTAEELQQMGVK